MSTPCIENLRPLFSQTKWIENEKMNYDAGNDMYVPIRMENVQFTSKQYESKTKSKRETHNMRDKFHVYMYLSRSLQFWLN